MNGYVNLEIELTSVETIDSTAGTTRTEIKFFPEQILKLNLRLFEIERVVDNKEIFASVTLHSLRNTDGNSVYEGIISKIKNVHCEYLKDETGGRVYLVVLASVGLQILMSKESASSDIYRIEVITNG